MEVKEVAFEEGKNLLDLVLISHRQGTMTGSVRLECAKHHSVFYYPGHERGSSRSGSDIRGLFPNSRPSVKQVQSSRQHHTSPSTFVPGKSSYDCSSFIFLSIPMYAFLMSFSTLFCVTSLGNNQYLIIGQCGTSTHDITQDIIILSP